MFGKVVIPSAARDLWRCSHRSLAALGMTRFLVQDVAVFLRGEPTPTDRRVLSDIDFDLMMKSGQHVQAIAIDDERRADQSYFVTNVLKDGLVA